MLISIYKSSKYFEITIDHHFNWKLHIVGVCNELQIRIILKKIYDLHFQLNKNTLYVVYYVLVDAIIGYGLSIYRKLFPTNLDEIKKLQYRFLKLLNRRLYVERIKTKNKLKIFQKYKVLPLYNKS